MARWFLRLLSAPVLAILLSSSVPVVRGLHRIDEKCSACNAIVYELDRALRFEIKGQSAIVVGRLDSRGKRVGRKTNYEVSELRVIEVMERLCPQMQHYGKTKMDDGSEKWQRVNYAEGDVVIDGTMTLGGAQGHTQGQELKVWCDAMVEKHEEQFEEAIKGGPEGLAKTICVDSLNVCGEDLKANVAELAPPPNMQRKPKEKKTPEEWKKYKLKKKLEDTRNDLARVEKLKTLKTKERDKLKDEIKRFKNKAQKLKENIAKLEAEEKTLLAEPSAESKASEL